MSFPWNITNPGWVIGTLTTAEQAFVTNLAGLSFAQGDIIYHDGSDLNRLPASTSGYFLKTQGAGANPVWAAVAGGGDMLASTYDPAAISEQLVGLVATQTLTNKTLTTPTITLKQSATPTPTAEGDIQWDTDNNQIKIGDGASTLTFSDDTQLATAAQGALADSALQNIVEDTTPQLGGSLDVNGQKIVSVSNGNIDIEPNGTGNVLLGNLTFDADQTVGAGQDNYVLTYDNASGVISLEAAASGSGDVVGPASATDNAVARFDSTTGKLLQNSGVTISDNGAIVTTIADTTNEVGLTINQNDTTNSPNALVVISDVGASSTTSSQHPLLVKSNSASVIGAYIGMFHNSASPAINDQPGGFGVFGNNSAAGEINYGGFGVKINDPTSTSEDAQLSFYTQVAGTNRTLLRINDGVLGISVGDNSNPGVVESTGSQDLVLQTGNATTGTITITDGANGDITLSPNGTGQVLVGANAVIDAGDAASTTASGIVELAIASEVNTGTDATRAITPDALAGSNLGFKYPTIAVVESDTAVSVADGKVGIPITSNLNGMEVKSVQANVYTKGVTGTTDIQLRKQRGATDADVLSTKVTIGDEYYAADGVVKTDGTEDLATGDMLFVDVDAVHSGTAPNGLSVTIVIGLP